MGTNAVHPYNRNSEDGKHWCAKREVRFTWEQSFEQVLNFLLMTEDANHLLSVLVAKPCFIWVLFLSQHQRLA